MRILTESPSRSDREESITPVGVGELKDPRVLDARDAIETLTGEVGREGLMILMDLNEIASLEAPATKTRATGGVRAGMTQIPSSSKKADRDKSDVVVG
jgi:hypothetical protein